MVLEVQGFVGVSWRPLVVDFGIRFFSEDEDLSGELFALGLEVFVEPFEEVSLNDGFVEFFLECDDLLLEAVIIGDKLLEFVSIDAKVVTALQINQLLLELMIFFAQVLNRIIEIFQIMRRLTVI